ncbi:MAG: endo-1,4-beta-xylanase [Planctomycetales bacterium]|nr:endo-1,4-beta-xylanase [Planctomycetales bacterium]
MRFVVDCADRLAADALDRLLLSGTDLVPWPHKLRREDDTLFLVREVSDSGNVYLPWMTSDHGEVVLATATLMERERPYRLSVEIARGTLQQVRNYVAEWRAIGLVVPEAAMQAVHEATAAFSCAATWQRSSDGVLAYSQATIDHALRAADHLVTAYVDQAMAVRHRSAAQLETILAVAIGRKRLNEPIASAVERAFNTAVVSLNWRRIETSEGDYNWSSTDRQIRWCHDKGLGMVAGPIVRFDTGGLPDWLFLWEDDFDNIAAFVTGYVKAAIERYRGKVSIWRLAARLGADRILSLSEEEKLRLVVMALETARAAHPTAAFTISFDQPWGEDLRSDDVDLAPLYLADTLTRSGLGLSGIELEMNVGYHPHGSSRRSLLSFNRLVDQWGMLGLPLYISLTYPSQGGSDAKARVDSTPVPGVLEGSGDPQERFVADLVPLLLAKPIVAGVVWNQLRDGVAHDFAHGGLFDADDHPKPAVDTLSRLRQQHLV